MFERRNTVIYPTFITRARVLNPPKTILSVVHIFWCTRTILLLNRRVVIISVIILLPIAFIIAVVVIIIPAFVWHTRGYVAAHACEISIDGRTHYSYKVTSRDDFDLFL